MKFFTIAFLCMTLFFAHNKEASALDLEYLTGDTALACEALLCLSSPHRPSECAPALARYFGIDYDKPWKTISARINFLNLCPASSEASVATTITSIVNYIEYCDLDALNENYIMASKKYYPRTDTWTTDWEIVGYKNAMSTTSNYPYAGQYCTEWYYYGKDDMNKECVEYTLFKEFVNPEVPNYCNNLYQDGNTYFDEMIYIGEVFENGKWELISD